MSGRSLILSGRSIVDDNLYMVAVDMSAVAGQVTGADLERGSRSSRAGRWHTAGANGRWRT